MGLDVRDREDTMLVCSSQANVFARLLAAADPGGAEVSVVIYPMTRVAARRATPAIAPARPPGRRPVPVGSLFGFGWVCECDALRQAQALELGRLCSRSPTTAGRASVSEWELTLTVRSQG